MTIYYYGCNCGTLGAQIRSVKRVHPDVELRNSKYSEDARLEHTAFLSIAGLTQDSYRAIVVDGDSVIPLNQWQS